jgi:DNA-binding LytR/AlgR family response regulator
VYLFTAAARYYSDLSLKALEQRLPRHLFRRIHRSTIVNTAHIRQISPLKSKRWQVVLSGGMKAVVSKRMAGVIRAAIHF